MRARPCGLREAVGEYRRGFFFEVALRHLPCEKQRAMSRNRHASFRMISMPAPKMRVFRLPKNIVFSRASPELARRKIVAEEGRGRAKCC